MCHTMKLNFYRYLIYSTMKVNFLLILFVSVDVDMKLEVISSITVQVTFTYYKITQHLNMLLS